MENNNIRIDVDKLSQLINDLNDELSCGCIELSSIIGMINNNYIQIRIHTPQSMDIEWIDVPDKNNDVLKIISKNEDQP